MVVPGGVVELLLGVGVDVQRALGVGLDDELDLLADPDLDPLGRGT